MSTTWASKISWIRSPTRSYIACMSRFVGEPPLDVVDRARSSAFALPRLLEQARVLEGDAQAPGERGQQTHVGVAERVLAVEVLERDDAGRPVADDERHEDARLRRLRPTSTNGCPCSRRDPLDVLVDDDRLARLEDVLAGSPMTSIGSSGKRTPRSIVYGKWIRPDDASTIPMSTTWASKISWIRSPTRSYIACMSSVLGEASLDVVDRARARRCAVASPRSRRARLSAEPTWLATKVRRSLSCSVWGGSPS